MSVRELDKLKLIEPLDYANMVSAVILHGKREHWMISVLTRSLDILRLKQIFSLNSLRGGRFIESQDQEMHTLYSKKSPVQQGCTYFLADNYHLRHINILKYTQAAVDSDRIDPAAQSEDLDCMNHVQKPDAHVRLKFKTEAGNTEQMAILYEAECNDKNDGKEKGKGGFIWNKMFQDMARCHDTNPEVSGVVICALMFRHNKQSFADNARTHHFDKIAAAYLQAHVYLLYYLVQYNQVADKGTSWIGGQLKKRMKSVKEGDKFDFICVINAQSNGHACSSSGDSLLDTVRASQGGEYEEYLAQMRKLYGTGIYDLTHADIVLGDRLKNWETTYERLSFNTTVENNRVGMRVLIYCVLRAPINSLLDSAPTKPETIRGALYPLHINAFIGSWGARRPFMTSLVNAHKTKLFKLHSQRLTNLLVWQRTGALNRDIFPQLIFGFGVHTTINIWNLWDATRENLVASVDQTNTNNQGLAVALQQRTVIQKFRAKRTNHTNIALSCELTGYFKFILPLMYLGMSPFIKISDDVQYSGGMDNTLKEFDEFVNSRKEDVISRERSSAVTSDKCGVLFTSKSNSLFKIILESMYKEFEEIKFDPLLEAFLKKECGWQNIDRSSSPAMIFKILGTTHLLSAHNFAQQVLASPPPRYTQIVQTFPPGLQVEIDFVMRQLAGHTIFKANFWQEVQHPADGDEETDADANELDDNTDEDD